MSHRRSKINGDQNVVNGVVTFRFIEGRVSNIEVSGTEHFNPEYFRSRLARGIEPPFNVNSLGQESWCSTRSTEGFYRNILGFNDVLSAE
jgi:hypothetical protein